MTVWADGQPLRRYRGASLRRALDAAEFDLTARDGERSVRVWLHCHSSRRGWFRRQVDCAVDRLPESARLAASGDRGPDAARVSAWRRESGAAPDVLPPWLDVEAEWVVLRTTDRMGSRTDRLCTLDTAERVESAGRFAAVEIVEFLGRLKRSAARSARPLVELEARS